MRPLTYLGFLLLGVSFLLPVYGVFGIVGGLYLIVKGEGS